jgi:outer membrane protein TolC
MDRSAGKPISRNALGRGAMHLGVLFWIVAGAGCQSVGTGDRPIVPLFGMLQDPEPRPLAVFGPPTVVKATPELVLTEINQDAGGDPKIGARETKESDPANASALNDMIRSCFVRDQIIDLESALRFAHVANPTIGLAEEVVQANLAERMMARSLLFPTLNAGTTLSMHQGSLLSARGVVQDVNRESLYFGSGADVRGAGTLTIPGVYLVANLSDAVFAPRVADQKVLTSRFDATATRNNVLLEVSKAYLGLVGAEARLLALRQSESEMAEVARLTSNFAAKGAGRESDAQRAKSELALLQSNAQAVEEEVIAWATELSRWLSADPSVRLRPEPGTPPLIQLVDERLALESLIETALASRPEIAARTGDVALYETRLRQERIRPLVPTISAGFSAGDFGGGSNQAGYRFSHFSGRTDFDVLAVWTLQNLGVGNRAIQNKVRAEIGQAEAHRAAMIDQVRREVAEALAQSKTSRLQLEIARRRVETAQKAYGQDLLRTKDRLGHLIEVLSSLNLLTAARQDLVLSMVSYSQSQFRLYVAIGGMPVALQHGDGPK